jgi:hypothetical protein
MSTVHSKYLESLRCDAPNPTGDFCSLAISKPRYWTLKIDEPRLTHRKRSSSTKVDPGTRFRILL